jgi:hypothetical protein
VFDAPLLEVPPSKTFDVPEYWTGPKPRHEARCAESALDVALEADKFRAQHFQQAFPATEAGVDKRFDRWLIDAKVMAETERGKALTNGGGPRKSGRVDDTPNPYAWVPTAEHRAFALEHGRDLVEVLAAYRKGGEPKARGTLDANEDFSRRLKFWVKSGRFVPSGPLTPVLVAPRPAKTRTSGQ